MTVPSTLNSSSKLTPAQQQWLDKVDEIIQERLSDSSFVVAQIAMELYTSERQFYRKLKKLTGKTPNQYIQRARIKRAYDMLVSGYSGELDHLSKAVGYQRADYFSNLYEQYYGRRPIQEINENKAR